MDILKDFKHHQSSSTTVGNCVKDLGFPCILTVKRDDYISEVYDLENESLELSPGTVIKLFAQLRLRSVRLRIEKVKNQKNLHKEEEKEFLSHRSHFEGSEINIPLNFKGHVKRLRNTEKGRKYEGVAKLMEDLPSCVQALDKISFVTPGVNAPATIAKGTKLFPDRNVPKKSTDTVSINQLICTLEDGKEIAIPANCKAHFVVVEGEKTFTVKDIVDKVALPQAVQFETVFPDNVVSRDDEEALNLMHMLDGPVSVISVKSTDVYVGCLSRMPGKYVPFILPVDHEVEVYASDRNAQRFLDNLYAPHLPSSLPLYLVEDTLYIIDTDDLHVHFLKDLDLEEAATVPPPRPPKPNDKAVFVGSSDAPPVQRRLKPYDDTTILKEAGTDDKPKIPPKSFSSKEASTHKPKAIKPPEPFTQSLVSLINPSDDHASSEASAENVLDSCYEDVSSFNTEAKNPPVPPRPVIKSDTTDGNNKQQKEQKKNKKTTSVSEISSKSIVSPTEKMENFSTSKQEDSDNGDSYYYVGEGQPPDKSSSPTRQSASSTVLDSRGKSPSTKDEEEEIPDYEIIPNTTNFPVEGQIRTSSENNVSSCGPFLPTEKVKTEQPMDDADMEILLLPTAIHKKTAIDRLKNRKAEMFRRVHDELRKKCKDMFKKKEKRVQSSTNVTKDSSSTRCKLNTGSDKEEIKMDLEQELEEDDLYDKIVDDDVFENSNSSKVEKDKEHAKKSIHRVQSKEEGDSEVGDDYVQIEEDTMPSNLTQRPTYIDRPKGIEKPKGLRYVPFPESRQMSVPDGNKDFFSLSVEEVVYMFEECGLPNLATVCKNEVLDGAFFREFKPENWKEEPFSLGQFHILKVQKIIEGWRPDLEYVE